MRVTRSTAGLGVAGLALVVGSLGMGQAEAAVKTYKNCTALNKVYPHGVGMPGAKDHTSGSKPVINFTRNAAVYKANTARDGDKDKVACEKR